RPDRPPERRRARDADGRRVRQGLSLVAEQGVGWSRRKPLASERRVAAIATASDPLRPRRRAIRVRVTRLTSNIHGSDIERGSRFAAEAGHANRRVARAVIIILSRLFTKFPSPMEAIMIRRGAMIFCAVMLSGISVHAADQTQLGLGNSR